MGNGLAGQRVGKPLYGGKSVVWIIPSLLRQCGHSQLQFIQARVRVTPLVGEVSRV
jgi:hypothetical protein